MDSSDVKLPYRYLGSSGLKVSTLCLGAMTFGQREVGNKYILQNVNILVAGYCGCGPAYLSHYILTLSSHCLSLIRDLAQARVTKQHHTIF